MAARVAVKTKVPQKITFTLGLKPPDKDDEKMARKGERPKYGVKLTGGLSDSWKNVRIGDQVQFVRDQHDPKLRGATIRVRFVGGEHSDAPKSPFNVNMIRSKTFHKVVKRQSKFWVRCFIITSDGAVHGYGYGGKVVCDNPPCR